MLDAGREAQIIRSWGKREKPVALTFPEGDYLKGLRVVAQPRASALSTGPLAARFCRLSRAN